MHSFLSKVFGRKKDDKETSPTTLAPGELLEGRFEAVSPNVSPTATKFIELDPKVNGHDKEKDNTFTFFKAKSRPASPQLTTKKLDTLPHLSLNFSDFKERSHDPELDVEVLLTDAVIGQRRLNPLEALILIRACSQAIIARGLETLGVMHPHWYSSSPEIQRRLISHFLNSLAPQSAISPLSPTLSSPISAFESEIHFTRDPHDVATVLRWGLRHLQLEGDHFGTDDGWYKAFLDAESAAEYPPKAFSEKLAPNLPPAHLELLVATLEIFSSLAAHSETNSTSGSKLSKIFGLWLLTARRVEDKDDWQSFYSRWESTGRMLEHLFLARIRDESTDQRMPIRLLELVRKYPYTQGLSSPTTDLQLLPRPRLTTSLYDALFVRIEFEYPTESRKPKLKIHPLNLIADAFAANIDSAEYAELWAKITAASKNASDRSPLSNIFADETIRFLSLVSDSGKGKEKEAKSPTFSLLPLSVPTSPIKRSFSAEDEPSTSTAAMEPAHNRFATDPISAAPISPLAIGSDWAQFSSSGFLDTTPGIVPLVSTLFDTDIEKTVPPDPPVQTLSRKSSRRAKRKSVDAPRTVAIADSFATQGSSADAAASIEGEESGPIVKATNLEIIQFDEAFIDFWSDSLLDPITSKWPTFIICKFNSTLVPQLTYGKVEEGKPQKTLKWLILEQVYTVKRSPPPAPVVAPPVADPELTEAARPSSPTASISGKKRWFWSVSRTPSTSSATSTGDKEKSRKKTPRSSEMGELVEEDGGKTPSSPPKNKKSVDQSRKSVDQWRKSLDQRKPVVQQAVAEGSTTATNAVVAAAAVAATGAAVLAAVPEDRPVEEEERQKAVLVTDADVKVSALEMTTASHAESPIEPVPTEVAAISEPTSNEEVAKLEPVSGLVLSKAEVIVPAVEEEQVVEGGVMKEVGIVPAVIEERVQEAKATEEEAEEKVVETEAAKEVEILPVTIEEEKVKEQVEKAAEDEAVKEAEIVPVAIEEEEVGGAKAMKEEVEEVEEDEGEIVPAAIEEEKVVEVEAAKEVGIVPAAIEEEEEEEEVEVIPAATEERGTAAELPKEELAIVEPVVLPSIPVVETEMPVQPEVAEEEVIAAELVAPVIVEVEDVHVVEAVAPVVEQDKVVETEPSQEELTITEPIFQPPALEVEASPTAEGPLVLEQPAPEENKAEDVETSAVPEPVSMIENAVIPPAAEETIEAEAAEPLPIVQPSVTVADIPPATEPEAFEPPELDELPVDNEDTQVDTEAVPIAEEMVEPISVPADSASEDIVVVEREETTESAPPLSETLLASDVEVEASPAPEHLQEVSAVALADVDSKEKDISAISANMEVDVEEEMDVSVEGFSVVAIPEPITSNEEWEVLAVSESEPAVQVVQQQVEAIPVVPLAEITASDEKGVLVPESESAVQVAEEKEVEESVEVVETEIAPGPLTDDLVEAKEEREDEQLGVEVVEEDVEEVIVKEVEAERVDEIAEETVKGVEDKAEEAEEAEEVYKADKVEEAEEVDKAESEIEIVPAAIEEEKVVEVEAVEEVGVVPAAIEEKVVEVEAVEEVEIVPAAIEEEKEDVGIIPAAIEEKGIDAGLPKEELAVVGPVVSPSVPVVEIEMPVEPEVAKEEVEPADEVEQKLQSPVVASVALPETEEACEPVSTLEGFSKSDAVVVEEEEVTEHNFLVPQAPVEDEKTPASAQDEEVAPTEDVVSAISATLESTGNVQEENSEDVSPKHVEAIAPVLSMEAIASNDEELLDVESEAVLEIIEAKPEEPQEAVEETNATVPVVEVVVEAEDEKVGIIDEGVEDEHEALPPSNDPVETETGVIIGEVEGRVAEVEDKTSAQVEAYVEVPAEVVEENVEVEGELVEEVSAAGATSEDLVDETTAAIDENAAEFVLKTTVEPVEVFREKEEEPVAAIEEETASAPPAIQPLQTSSEFVGNVEDSAVIEEEVVIERVLSEPALDLSSVEEVTPEPTKGIEGQLEEPIVAIVQDENASPLVVPESVEGAEGKVEGVVGVEDVMAKPEDEVQPEDEAPFDTASEVIEEKGGVPAVQVEEEVPAVAPEVLLETSLEGFPALHEETSTSSFALEAEAGPVEPFDQKEDAIVEALAPEHTEMTSVDPIIPVEEKEIPVHIPEQEPETEEVQQVDEVTMVLEETTPVSSIPVEIVESVEVIEENAGERALATEDEAEPFPAAISEVDLGASSAPVEENSGDGTQVVEEQTALNLEHIAKPPTEAVEEVMEATEPDVEELAAQIETQAVVVISEPEPLTGAGEDVEAVEVVPSSDNAVRQTAEEPIITPANIEVAPIPVSVYENVEEKQANGIDQATQADVIPGHLEAAVEQVVEIGQKEAPVAEAQLEQPTAIDQNVVEALSVIETEAASGPIVTPEAADDLIERGLEMATPTAEETIGPVEHVPASEIPVEPVLAIAENDTEEPNTVTEEEFPVPASESPLAVDETVRGFDHQAEEKTIVVETELHPPSETSEEPIASIPPQAYREESSSPKAVDPTFEDKGAVDTPAVLETLVAPEPVEVMPVLQPTLPPALEATFEQDTPDQHAATIDDAVETSKLPLISEPETSPAPLAEEVTSHTVASDSQAPPTFDSGDEATENAPKTLEEVPSVDLPNLPAETPLVGPSEDATTADIDMSSGRLDNAVAPKEGTPSISALITENVPVEASAAAHGEYPSFAEEHVGHFSTVPIAEALEPNVEYSLSEMESHRDVIDDSVLPVLQAEQPLEAPIAQVKELTPLSETQAFVAEPISVPSELFSPEVPAVDGDQETSILVKDDSEVLPTPVDIELETEVSEPTAVDSLPDNQNSTLETATGVVSYDPSSLTEQHVASETNLPTLVEGVLVEAAPVSEEQERTSAEVKDVAPVLEGQTIELAEVGVDGVREGPTNEEPKADEETLATDSFPDIAGDVGRNDVAPSQELVPDIQFATPTPIPEAQLAETSEESTPLPAVEPVLASASPIIENLAVPEAEESISLDAADEVEATGDEESQAIYEELVAEAEADAPMVDPVIPAPDTAAACDSETVETPAEHPSGAENLFSTEAEAETVEDPASPQEPIAEIDESTPLQVEESQIAELEPVLVDSSPIEVELQESVAQKPPTIEAGNVELVPTPPFEESVTAEHALVEDALVQEALVEDTQHEESNVIHDVQGAVVSEPNLVDDSGTLESQELIGAEEPDTGPIVEEDSVHVAENQLVDKSAPSDEGLVEDSKDEVEIPIAVDAPLTEDIPAVTETPFEATVPVVEAPSLVDEPELLTADVDIGGDFGSAPELTSESEVGGGIDSTISEVLEVPKALEFANVVETLDSAGGVIVDEVPEAEVVSELLDATANEHDASKDLEADPNPPSNTAPVEVAEDSTSSSIEVVPKEMDIQKPPIVEADVEPAPSVPSFEGPVAAEDALVEDAQNEESAITQEPIPVHSLHEEIASESSAVGDTALVSQESIAAPEESNAAPIVEENSTPVAENQPVDETALSIENVVEESTVELDDPIAVPEPIAEESPAIAELTLESTIPVVEPLSVVDEPESPAPAIDADVSDEAALVAEDSTDATELIGESKALNTHGENDLNISVEVPKVPEAAAILAEAETLDSTGDSEGIDVVGSAANAPEAEVTEILDAAANEHHASKDLEADPNPAGETAPVEDTEESTTNKSTQIEPSSELPLVSETSHVVVDQPTSATEDLEAEESPTLETDVIAGDSTTVEAQVAEEMPPVALEEPTQNESPSDAPDVAPTPADPPSPSVVDAEVHADLEEEPTTVTTEGTAVSLTPIAASEEPTAAEAGSFTPPNETLIENIQVEEGSTPVTESAVAESIAPAAEEESTMANAQELMEVADILTDSLHVQEPVVIQQHETSDVNAPIPANDAISDVLTKDLAADTEETLPIITSEEKIDSGAASAPDVEADIIPPALEVAAEAGPVEGHTFEPEITPIVDSALLEPPSIEETSEAIPVDEAITTHPSSAPIVDNSPSSPGATATEEPVFSDDILDDVSNSTEVEGTALEEASVPTAIEEPTPTEHPTDPILDATIAQEPIAIADVEDIEVKDEPSAIESPVVTDSAIVEVDPPAEEQTMVGGEPTFTIPPVESVTSENPPALEETTTVINRASDIIVDGGQNEVPLLESQSVADSDAEAPAKLVPLDTTSLQDSETVIEEDSNVEDDVPVDGPVPVEAALPANDSVPLNINDLESTPTAPEESTHIEGTPEPVVQEDLPVVHDIAATEIAPSSSIVVEDGPIEVNAPEHIAEGPATTEPLAGPAESLETAEEENVAEISAPTDLDPIISAHEDFAGNQDASLVVINEDVHVAPVDVEGFTPHEPAVSEDLLIAEDTTATETVRPSSIAVVEDGPVEANAAEHVPEEPAAETTKSLEPKGGSAAAEISAPTEEIVTAAGPDPMTPIDEVLADNPDPSPVVADEDVAPIDVEGTTLHEPTVPEDLLIVEDTAATGVASPSSIVVEDGPVEANAAGIAEEPTESLETTTAEGPAEISALTEEVVTAAEPDSTIPIQEALVDSPDPSPVVVNEDVAPIDVEISTPYEPTAPADLIIEDTTATEVAPPSIVVVEDAAEHTAEEPAAESTASLEITTAEGETAEISAPVEVITEAEADPAIPIHDNLADSQGPSPIVVDEDIAPEDVAPVDVEGSTLHEPAAPEDLSIVQDTMATEVAPPSSIVVEDESVEANVAEHIGPESAAVEPTEGENVVAEISAPIEEGTPAAEPDPTPIHEDLIENQDPSPPLVVNENVAPVNVEESAPLEPPPAMVEDDLNKSLDVSSNAEATTLLSAPEPNLESAEAEPTTGEVEIDEVVPDELPHQEEDDLSAVPALDNSDTDISSQEFEDIILELETAAAAEVPVSDDNGHLASSGLGDVDDGSTVEDDKPVELNQEILAADDTVAAAEVAAEGETLAGNGHSEFSELDKQISVKAPVSNGHGHKIDEVLEVPRPEVQLDSNSAEVSIGNGHDSKVHDVLQAPEVAELSPPTTSAEADVTPAIENQ